VLIPPVGGHWARRAREGEWGRGGLNSPDPKINLVPLRLRKARFFWYFSSKEKYQILCLPKEKEGLQKLDTNFKISPYETMLKLERKLSSNFSAYPNFSQEKSQAIFAWLSTI